jgi:signal peptidase II
VRRTAHDRETIRAGESIVVTPKSKTLLTTFVSAVTLDQLTKAWVSARIPAGSMTDSIPVVDGFFYITHARNPGAAFGLLVDWPHGWRMVVFLGVALLAISLITSFYRGLAPGERLNAMALGLILAGSVGNLIDRAFRGEVVDFLHFRLWRGMSWPDFNVADACIIMGVTALIIELLASEGAARARRASKIGSGEQDDHVT